MRKAILIFIIICGIVSANAQAVVNYSFDITERGIFLIERIEKTIRDNPRKQVIETPVFMADTSEVRAYISSLRRQQAQLEEQIQAALNERDFLRSKIQVISGLADSTFFKPKTVAKQ